MVPRVSLLGLVRAKPDASEKCAAGRFSGLVPAVFPTSNSKPRRCFSSRCFPSLSFEAVRSCAIPHMGTKPPDRGSVARFASRRTCQRRVLRQENEQSSRKKPPRPSCLARATWNLLRPSRVSPKSRVTSAVCLALVRQSSVQQGRNNHV